MDQIHRVLQKFGLNDNEIKIYRETLKEDNLGPFKLSRLTGIPRTTIYETLMNLSLKGLITLDQSDGFTKQQTKVHAQNPSVLREIIFKKRHSLSSLDLDIIDILPVLKGDFQHQEPNADFRFYPGIEGAKTTYFSPPTDIHLPIHAFENMMPTDAFGKESINQNIAHLTQLRQKHHSETKIIFILNDWTKHVISYQSTRDPNYYRVRQFRFIDQPGLFINQRLLIQGQLILITCISGNEAWGLSLNSPSLAQTFESLFQFIWQSATPLTPEIVASWEPDEYFAAEKKKK
jgi:hypothetical protein